MTSYKRVQNTKEKSFQVEFQSPRLKVINLDPLQSELGGYVKVRR